MNRYFSLLVLATFLTIPCAFIRPQRSSPEHIAKAPNTNPAVKVQAEAREGKDKETQGSGFNDETIARLIRQLGDEDFLKREEATRALEAIGARAWDALRKATNDDDIEIAARASGVLSRIENTLDALVAEYRFYGLPFPPADARLVQYEIEGLADQQRSIAFLLRQGSKKNPAHLLVGMGVSETHATNTMEFVEPRSELAKTTTIPFGGLIDEVPAGLAVALQCHARGWHALAQELWTTHLSQLNRMRSFYNQPELSNRSAVAYLAWDYSRNEAVEPGTDRWDTLKRMKAIMAAEPTLDNEDNRRLVKSLETALVPSKAKPGSVERMIDDLVDMHDRIGCQSEYSFLIERGPQYSRLGQKGFAAIPALIQHLDDDRMTRSLRTHFALNGFNSEYNVSVKHVASLMLMELAGSDVGKDWVESENDDVIDKAVVQAWWDKAQMEGEEAYLLKHFFTSNSLSPPPLMLEIIKIRYPEHLPKLYKKIVAEARIYWGHEITKAIADSSLPDAIKCDLLQDAARDKNQWTRRSGLKHLQKIDAEQFMKLLLRTLESFPVDSKEMDDPRDEIQFVDLVQLTEDERAWKMLEKLAKRSDVGMRKLFLDKMSEEKSEGRQTRQRLKFLEAFLNEDQEATIRNKATDIIAEILDIPVWPDENWTPEQWEKLRNQVRERLKQ